MVAEAFDPMEARAARDNRVTSQASAPALKSAWVGMAPKAEMAVPSVKPSAPQGSTLTPEQAEMAFQEYLMQQEARAAQMAGSRAQARQADIAGQGYRRRGGSR